MSLRTIRHGFDHIEWAVKDLSEHEKMWSRLGFEKIGSRSGYQGLNTSVWAQGFVRIMLTAPDGSNESMRTRQGQFLEKHGDGVCVLALDVENVEETYQQAMSKGAESGLKPQHYTSPEGEVKKAEVFTPSDLRYGLVERKVEDREQKALLDENLVVDRLSSPTPCNIRIIDHLTNNVSMGEMKKWVEWYQRVFDFEIIRHFDIKAGKTGLTSDAMRSKDGKITVPINEATEPESQVQEFVERFNGAGVQHLALLTTDIMDSVGNLGSNGFKFLSIPHTYYEQVPKRVAKFDEDIKELEDRQILLDSEGEGYLLQIFTEEMVGPFFFEFIQRKGNNGFGEGNFKALFEAVERDQIKRGVLTA